MSVMRDAVIGAAHRCATRFPVQRPHSDAAVAAWPAASKHRVADAPDFVRATIRAMRPAAPAGMFNTTPSRTG
ncbi:X-prolyl-dipeptidyl aminopeptidase [Burkholderia humptydooensis]|nr:X-prolyl-dipeptidyl aminopeptidase [Burkholderia humptydooensis]